VVPSRVHCTGAYPLTADVSIHVISAPYFVATKLEAFADRGKGDYLASADLEDIITVVDGRSSLPSEARRLPDEARRYLATEFTRFLADRDFIDVLPGHLDYQNATAERLGRLRSRLLALSRL
jgi:hypothetical protein